MSDNCYEYLYMARTGDVYALNMLFQMHSGMISAVVGSMIAHYPPLYIYREDFTQQARIALSEAVDYYRGDQSARFQTFVELVVRRTLLSELRHLMAPQFVQPHNVRSLEARVAEREPVYELIASKDHMMEPDYHLGYQLAMERMDERVLEMNAMQKAVYTTWQDGSEYQEAMVQLNMTYKSYDGRLQRVKQKLKDAILNVH